MVKNIFIFIAVCLLSLASCQDKMTSDDCLSSDICFEYPVQMTFHGCNSPTLKTVLNYETILWERGDAIKVLWGENRYNKAEAKPFNSSQNADFETTVEEADVYYGIYPYSAASSLTDGCLNLTVPSAQSGIFRDVNLAVAKADQSNRMTFSHVVGYIEFTTDVTGVLQISGGQSNCLSGTVKVTGFDQSGKPVYEVTGGSSTISLDVKTSGTYYIAVLPDVRMDYLYISMTDGDKVQYILSPNTLQFTPGKLIALGNITDRFSPTCPIGATLESFKIEEFDFNSKDTNF